MEESKKLLILRILLIIAAIFLIINIIPNIMQKPSTTLILYPIIAVVLIVIAIKIEDIPMREYLLLILGIVIMILGFWLNEGGGLISVILAAILVILAGLLDLAIKT